MVRPRRTPGNRVSDIFNEVDEELRAEKARAFLRRYAGLLIALAVLAVAAAGFWQWWQYHVRQREAALGGQFLAAMRLADAPDAASHTRAITAFAAIVRNGTPGYRALARLREAALRADAGQAPAANALWLAVADDAASPALLRQVGGLDWVMHNLDHGDPKALASRLGPLADPTAPFHALAQEEQGLLALRTGDRKTARTDFARLAADVTAPQGVRARATALLAQMGPAGS